MNKLELIRKMTYSAQNKSLVVIDSAVRVILDSMTEALLKNKRVEIRGFGNFTPKIREARDARNPKTGSLVLLDQRTFIHFKPGKELRERVNAALQTTH